MNTITPLTEAYSVSRNSMQQSKQTALTGQEADHSGKNIHSAAPLGQGDAVQIHMPAHVLDDEAQQAVTLVQDSLQEQADEALSVHGGLDYARVMSLLADL